MALKRSTSIFLKSPENIINENDEDQVEEDGDIKNDITTKVGPIHLTDGKKPFHVIILVFCFYGENIKKYPQMQYFALFSSFYLLFLFFCRCEYIYNDQSVYTYDVFQCKPIFEDEFQKTFPFPFSSDLFELIFITGVSQI